MVDFKQIDSSKIKEILGDNRVRAGLAIGILLMAMLIMLIIWLNTNLTQSFEAENEINTMPTMVPEKLTFEIDNPKKYAEYTAIFKSRDIFEPFSLDTVSGSVSTTGSYNSTSGFSNDPDSLWDGKTNDDPSTPQDDPDNPSDNPDTPPDDPADDPDNPPDDPADDPADNTLSVKLSSVFESQGSTYARISYNGDDIQSYIEGDELGTYFEIIDIDNDTESVVLLYGDERVILYEGDTVTKDIKS